jgi:succinate-semialdehyde dehydrogenase/glutarate-semialdehyde dehydrogenase
LTNVTGAHAVSRSEETFGPVAPVLVRFKTEEDRSLRWPTTPSSAWPATSTAATCRPHRSASAEALEYGMVGHQHRPDLDAPRCRSAGSSSRGLGREGGSQGIAEYLDCKFVAVGGLNG